MGSQKTTSTAPSKGFTYLRGDDSATARAPRRRRSRIATFLTVVALALGALLIATPAAYAASYRDLKSSRYGTCLYAYSGSLDHQLKNCKTTPTKYGNWQTTVIGYYNGHPLWVISRQGGTCLGVLGSATNSYLYSSCTRQIWEVFTSSSGRYVLKSFSAYQSWGQHRCLTFAGPVGNGRPQLGACSLTSTAGHIYR